MPTKISATVITYNEEQNIRRCLESLAWADEIVVVDSMSADRTVGICREFGAKVIQRPWPGHVRQKNFAMEQASHQWVISLDADEQLSAPLKEEIMALRESEALGKKGIAGYYMPRRTQYLGQWINHCGWYPDRKLRLFDKTRCRWGGDDPHDSIICDGRTDCLKGDILHYSFPGISSHLATIDNFTTIAARGLKAANRKASLWDIVLRPPFTFFKMYVLSMGFLDGLPGLAVCVLSACHVFVKYVKLWEYWRES